MDIPSLVKNVDLYMQQHLPRYIEELSTLCAIDSYSFYKPGLDEVATYLATRMHNLGMDVRIAKRESWGNDLLGVISGEGHGNVLLLGHTDTVYPVGTAVSRPVHIEGDTIYGPGVCDMKGCILAALYAVEAILAMNYRDFGQIRFLCVSDEEITDRHCLDIIQQAAQDCHAALVLEAARADGDIVSARKGNAWYTLSARGRSAHAGVEPEKGRNAIVEIAYQTLQFQGLNGWREGITINPGVITGGTLPNVVPDMAQVQFDLRFLHSQDRLDTEARWREIMQQQRVPDVELMLYCEPDFKEPLVCTPASLKIVRRAQDIAGMLGFSINHVLTGGASDSSYTSGYGIPTIDGLGPIGGLDHSPGEYIKLSSIAPRTALLAGLLVSIDTLD
ncbi:MAG: M20 family metallopeptidase [Ktedonobacteraceae bacterium]